MYRSAVSLALATLVLVPTGAAVGHDYAEATDNAAVAALACLDTPPRTLTLKGPGVTDAAIEPLLQIPGLHELYVDGVDWSPAAFRRLEELPRLERLFLEGELGDDHLAALGGCANLRVLCVTGHAITGAAFPRLRRLTLLRTLWIESIALQTLEGVEALRNVRELTLFRTTLTDDDLAPLAGLVDLRHLSCRSERICGAGLLALTSLPRLRFVGSRASPEFLEVQRALPHLRVAYLSDYALGVTEVHAFVDAHPELTWISLPEGVDAEAFRAAYPRIAMRSGVCGNSWDAYQDPDRAAARADAMTPLMEAILRRDEAAVDAALEGSTNIPSADGSTGRAVDALAPCPGIEGFLDFEPHEEPDWTTATPLFAAALLGEPSVVRRLLDEGADLSVPSENGSTCLMAAAANGDEAIVAALLRAGADVGARTASGWTALMHAAMRGQAAAVELLLAAGATTTDQDEYGMTAATLASEHRHRAIAARLRR